MKNINAWKEAISNAEQQIENQSIRMSNLDLMNSHLSKAWIAHTEKLQIHKKQ